MENIQLCFTYKTSHLEMTFLAVFLTLEVVGSVFKVHLQETVINIHRRELFNTRSGVSGDSKDIFVLSELRFDSNSIESY